MSPAPVLWKNQTVSIHQAIQKATILIWKINTITTTHCCAIFNDDQFGLWMECPSMVRLRFWRNGISCHENEQLLSPETTEKVGAYFLMGSFFWRVIMTYLLQRADFLLASRAFWIVAYWGMLSVSFMLYLMVFSVCLHDLMMINCYFSDITFLGGTGNFTGMYFDLNHRR